jgi:phosphoglycerate dehydrogenase-like enzyme
MKVLVTDMRHSSIEEERKVLEPAGVRIDTTFCRNERIGRRVAQCLRPLVAEILFYDPYYAMALQESGTPDEVSERKGNPRNLRMSPATGSAGNDWQPVDSLTDLVERCQVLSIHAPLNEETHHLIDSGLLARAKRLILVNTSRADLINREALERALVEGHVSFFGSDVFWQEPPDYSEPRTGAFLKRRDVLVTPHMAWYSEDSEREVRRRAAEKILRVLQGGQPLHGLHPA